MDLSFSAEQRLLSESLTGYLARHYDFEARRNAAATEGWRPDIWRGFAEELGLLGAGLSEAEGGFGGGPVETMLIAEALGHALAMEPYVEGVVMACALLRDGGDTADKLRAAILSGEAIVAPALYERAGRFDPTHVETSARSSADESAITGGKALVVSGPIATHFLVSARDAGGVSLFLIAASAAGIDRRDYRLLDGRTAADLQFTNVSATLVGEAGASLDRTLQAVDEAIAATCAEGVGLIDRMIELTADYLRQREQFGVAIGSFQALQHRMADMLSLLERSRSVALMAALSLDLPAGQRRRAISGAKSFVGQALKTVGEGAIQLHGGIGITDEVAISHYFKRAMVLYSQYGTPGWHLQQMAIHEA